METQEPIDCGVTGWFYRRTILPGLVCLGLSGWFFFDAVFVYPEKMRVYQEYRAYTLQRELLLLHPSDPLRQRAEKEWDRAASSYPEFSKDMRWPALAQRYGWAETNPPEWQAWARSKGYFERPAKKHRVLPADIVGQFVSGALFLVAASVFLGNALVSSRKRLLADHESLLLPGGVRIPFASIVQIDNRKWYDQGISRIQWRNTAGKVQSARIDCLKFDTDGAERIMQRILATPGIVVLPGK